MLQLSVQYFEVMLVHTDEFVQIDIKVYFTLVCHLIMLNLDRIAKVAKTKLILYDSKWLYYFKSKNSMIVLNLIWSKNILLFLQLLLLFHFKLKKKNHLLFVHFCHKALYRIWIFNIQNNLLFVQIIVDSWLIFFPITITPHQSYIFKTLSYFINHNILDLFQTVAFVNNFRFTFSG